MRKISLLSLVIALASCAPTVMVETPTVMSRAFAAPCADVLQEVAATAPQIRPASVAGNWGAFRVTDRQGNSLSTTSQTGTSGVITGGMVLTNQSITTIVWQCADTSSGSTLMASSTGQRANFAQAALDAYFGALSIR